MFKITYDVRVKDDISRFSKSLKVHIQKAIEDKLQISPEIFGKPLRHSLHGFRRLRVGEYRIVFLLKDDEVLILLIAHRKEVYERVEKRAGWL